MEEKQVEEQTNRKRKHFEENHNNFLAHLFTPNPRKGTIYMHAENLFNPVELFQISL
jgi:hypothetical protein